MLGQAIKDVIDTSYDGSFKLLEIIQRLGAVVNSVIKNMQDEIKQNVFVLRLLAIQIP